MSPNRKTASSSPARIPATRSAQSTGRLLPCVGPSTFIRLDSEFHEIQAPPGHLQPVSTRRKILTGRMSGPKRESNVESHGAL